MAALFYSSFSMVEQTPLQTRFSHLTLCLYSLLVSSVSFGENVALEITAGAQHFFYREYDTNDEKLNEERGWIPATTIALHYSPRPYVRASIYSQQSGDDVGYRGKTNFGNTLITRTKETFSVQGVSLSVPVVSWPDSGRNMQWINDLSWSFWKRDIQPRGIVSGLYEEYKWGKLSSGVDWLFFNNDAWTVSYQLSLSVVILPEMKVDLEPQGFRKASLPLREKMGWGSVVSLNYQFLDNYQLVSRMAYQYWRFGASDTVQLYNDQQAISMREPDSETGLWELSLSLQKRF